MKIIETTQEKRIEAAKALEFLRNHPAVNPDIHNNALFDGAWFHMEACCKHGHSEYTGKYGVTVGWGDEGYEKYKDLFNAEYTEEEIEKHRKEDSLILVSVDVPYERYYGEPWAFDHMGYWYETTFYVFQGDPYKKFDDMDYKNWQGYSGPEGGANTFEDMLIKQAKAVKEEFGDFNQYKDFIDDVEKDASEKNTKEFFDAIRNTPENTPISLPENPLDVGNGLINLRWLKWYKETDNAKKNWDHSFKEWDKLIEKIDSCMPEERKEIDKVAKEALEKDSNSLHEKSGD